MTSLGANPQVAERIGALDAADRIARAITVLMAFGFLSWALQLHSRSSSRTATPPVRPLIIQQAMSAFGSIRGMWLSFVYIGTVLLLVARDPIWLRRLSAFGWTGRMALTNYMLQVAILDLMFANMDALGLALTTLESIAAALALSVSTPSRAVGG